MFTRFDLARQTQTLDGIIAEFPGISHCTHPRYWTKLAQVTPTVWPISALRFAYRGRSAFSQESNHCVLGRPLDSLIKRY
jgi:hypothetical protein